MTHVPARLAAPEPGWTQTADVVVVGSGIAGLTAALRLRAELGEGATIVVVTKDVLAAGSTQWAQGGIAAALGPEDTPQQHEVDTLVAGAGGCDLDAVRALVSEGADAVRELIELGTLFDTDPDGELSLTREGGHHRDRIAHAGGDATGAEIQRALIAAVRRAPEIELIEHALVVDLVLAEPDRPGATPAVAGVTLHVMGEGQRDGVGLLRSRAVVLASGGLGQVFSQTTNPAVSTADGMAVALRAGARLRDLEFVQFHPTVMYLGEDSRGQQPLISEAVRGEGAVLLDWDGNPLMAGVHELADLAPRDVVAKAIMQRMIETGKPHMWLDARRIGATAGRAAPDVVGRAAPDVVGRAAPDVVGRVAPVRDERARIETGAGGRVGGEERAAVAGTGDRVGGEERAAVSRFWERRFPTILAVCREHGIDPVTDLIPVAPACHYASGGVHTDLWGRTGVPGLYATGEVACSGVHGANRLASNSLLEGLVFSRRIAAVLPGELPPLAEPAVSDPRPRGLVPGTVRAELQELMTARVGVLRTAAGLTEAVHLLGELAARPGAEPDQESWEASNLVTVAAALAGSALARQETRGSHWREDFPVRDDDRWAGHLDVELVPEGDGARTRVGFTASSATDTGLHAPRPTVQETT